MKTVLIIDEIHYRFLKKFNKTMSNDIDIACLSKNFGKRNLKGVCNIITPYDYLSKELDAQIVNEAAIASREWARKIQNITNNSIFKHNGIDLQIPSIHLMGIGYYPETFFQGVIRGYRYTEKIINELKPQKIILVDDKTPATIGSKIAIDKIQDIMDFSIEHYKIDRIRKLFNKIYRERIKPILQLGRDVYYIVKNSIWIGRQKSHKKQQILYFPIYYNRIRLVKSVLKELVKRNYNVKLVRNNKDCHRVKIKQAIKEIGLPFSKFNKYLSIDNFFQLLKSKAYFGNYKVTRSLQNDFDNEISMIVNKTFEEATNYYMHNSYYGLILSAEILGSIMEIESPKLLLFNTDEGTIGKIAALIGKKNNIPVINMDHALQFDAPRISDLLFTKMAVSGSLNKEIFIKNGAKEEQIEITGMPIHDLIYKTIITSNKKKILRKLGLNHHNKNILLLTHPNTNSINLEIREQIITKVLHIAENLEKVNLIIKTHPNEVDGLVELNVSQAGLENVIVLDELDELYELMNLSDLVITNFNSTTAIEAALFNKPVLILNFSGQINPLLCAKDGVAIEIINSEDISKNISNLLYDQNIIKSLRVNNNKFINRYAYKLDGNAHLRVCNLIEETVKKYYLNEIVI